MKKFVGISALVLICIMLSGAQASAGVFVEGWNVSNSYSTSVFWGAAQVAWRYVPTQTYQLDRVEFLCGAANRNDVTIQLRADSYGTVGTVLSSGQFDHSATFGWQGADITPYGITAGQAYWVTMWPVNGLHANITFDYGALNIPYRYGFDGTGNTYPDYYAYHAPMAKFYGSESNLVPEPATMSFLALGLGVLGLKRKGKGMKR